MASVSQKRHLLRNIERGEGDNGAWGSGGEECVLGKYRVQREARLRRVREGRGELIQNGDENEFKAKRVKIETSFSFFLNTQEEQIN